MDESCCKANSSKNDGSCDSKTCQCCSGCSFRKGIVLAILIICISVIYFNTKLKYMKEGFIEGSAVGARSIITEIISTGAPALADCNDFIQADLKLIVKVDKQALYMGYVTEKNEDKALICAYK